MKITKYGHCCLLIEVNRVRFLTDPGAYSTGQVEARDIDVVLVTHEHPDHLHIESLKTVLLHNPQAKVYTNKGVGAIFLKEGIAFELLEQGERVEVRNIVVEGFGLKHAYLYYTVPPVDNTGYMIANSFFYPGDALTNPERPVEILALPVAGPWITVGEAIDYAKLVQPQSCFPVHDGGLKHFGAAHKLSQTVLESCGMRFVVLEEGKETDLASF